MTFWIVVPAAGTGSRFGAETPKQYQLLSGQPVITRTLEKLLALQPQTIVVAVNKSDQQWIQLPIFNNPLIRTVIGGNERVDSVRAGLESLSSEANKDDWVLVHDVARPCVLISDIEKLINTLVEHPVGGILATSVSDTIKRVAVGQQEVQCTEDRSELWAAQTPQMFRYGLLVEALANADGSVTDEASAIERLGHTPLVVEGSRDNIKITCREDMAIATAIIDFQKKSQESHQDEQL